MQRATLSKRLGLVAFEMALILALVGSGSEATGSAMPAATGAGADMAVAMATADAGLSGLASLLARASTPIGRLLFAVVSSHSGSASVERVQRIAPPTRLSSKGQPIEVGPAYRFEYRDGFEKQLFKDDPAIDGEGVVRWDRAASTVHLRGCEQGSRPITLSYHFTSPYTMKDPLTELEGEIVGCESDRVELAFSYDGRRFGHAACAFGREEGNPFHLTTNANKKHNGGNIWVRITATLSPHSHVKLTSFRTACRVKADERTTTASLPAGRTGLIARN